MDNNNIKSDFLQVMSFMIEIEQLKNIFRQSRPVNLDRQENSAEHSWQVALLALTLAPYAKESIDVNKVVKMLLVHDIVEVDAGDKMIYSQSHEDYENELKAAQRLFGMLPKPIGTEYMALWQEFEAMETTEANYAKAVDRLMPVMQNLHNDKYQTWTHHNIPMEQVLEVNCKIASIHPDIWDVIKEKIQGVFDTQK